MNGWPQNINYFINVKHKSIFISSPHSDRYSWAKCEEADCSQNSYPDFSSVQCATLVLCTYCWHPFLGVCPHLSLPAINIHSMEL